MTDEWEIPEWVNELKEDNKKDKKKKRKSKSVKEQTILDSTNSENSHSDNQNRTVSNIKFTLAIAWKVIFELNSILIQKKE